MISFAELSSTWSNTVLCGYKYTYQIEVNCALKHLNNYFGARDCEKIKGLDVEKFLVFESEIVNPNTGKPFSKRVLNDHVDVGNTIYEFGLDNDIIHCRNPFQRKRKKSQKVLLQTNEYLLMIRRNNIYSMFITVRKLRL